MSLRSDRGSRARTPSFWSRSRRDPGPGATRTDTRGPAARCRSWGMIEEPIGRYAVDAVELHRRVEEAFNLGDVDALVALYEDDAQMVRDDGGVAIGLDAIRDIWTGFVALGGRISMETRFAVEQDDVALLSNRWEFSGAGMTLTATTAEVARRGSDGIWRYAIDNPFGLAQEAP